MSLFLFVRRFCRRLRFTFRFREMWDWEYESCNRCGINYRLPIDVQNDVWIVVNGKEGGCLCVNCFLQIAEEKGFIVKKEHIHQLYVFNPKGKGFDIIRKGG